METADTALQIKRTIPDLEPQIVAWLFDFPLANSTLMSLLITVLIVIFVQVAVRKFQLRPTKFQIAAEMMFNEIVGLVDQITNSRKHSLRIFPVIAALLVYLAVANLIGLIPGLTSITIGEFSLFQTSTADFNTTFGLALAAVLVIQVVSIAEWGLLGHIGKYFKFKEVIQGFSQGIGKGFYCSY